MLIRAENSFRFNQQIIYMKHTQRRFTIAFFLFAFALLLGNPRASGQVTANFSSDTTEGCEVLELQLNNLSTGATSYYWEVLDASGTVVSSSTLTNPVFFLITPGSYTVSLTAYGPGGSSDNLTISGFATVNTPPEAIINASSLSGCAPFTATFTNASLPGSYGSIDDFYWVIFGGPTLPADPSITYTFATAGTYTVYLFVADAVGCSDYTTVTVHVMAPPVPSFTSSASVSCATPLTVNFTNTTTGTPPLSYFWDFGDGSTSTAINPSHTYTTLGYYDVTLTATDGMGCSATYTYYDYVQLNTSPTVNFAPSQTVICAGSPVSFTNLSGAATATWAWDFGDGSTSGLFEPTHTYTAPGTYSVSLSADFGAGCSGDTTFIGLITVEVPPVISFTSSSASSICHTPFSVSFNPSITGTFSSVEWIFENAGFSDTVTTYAPTYTWNTPGTFDVTLIVFTAGGCSTTYYMPDYVSIGSLDLSISASPSSGCYPLTTTFSASASEPLSGYIWNFWDGSNSTASNPTHIYNTIGCHDVSLVATSVDGCVDTIYVNDMVCVGDTETALLGVPDTSCPGVPVEVGYLPLDSIVGIIDGGADYTSASPVTSTTTVSLPPGDHTVDFITWNHGCTDTMTANIHVLDVTDSLLSVTYNCADPNQVQLFIDTALADMSCGWVWNFGDGTTDSATMNPVHEYAAAGTYHVTVTYYCISTDPCVGTGIYVTIKTPFAEFVPVPDVRCTLPAPIYFSDFSTDGISADGITYAWNFGDGGTSTINNPTHTYYTPGSYIVDLVVTDTRGCTAETSDTVDVSTINADLVTDAGGGCLPFSPVLTDASTTAGATIDLWILNWDDGVIDTFYTAADLEAATHTYIDEDYYDLTLIVQNNFGCADTDTVTIVASAPVADFTVSDTIPCLADTVAFTQLSTGYDLAYAWDFGDGTGSTDSAATHNYPVTGSFPVTLTVTDVNGCSDSYTYPAAIQPDTVEGDFYSNILLSSCNYALVQFYVVSPDSLVSYTWDFGDGSTSDEASPIHPYVAAGIYTVSVTVTDLNGCTGTFVKEGYAIVPGPYGNITLSEDTICAGQMISLFLNYASTDTAIVYYGNGDLSNFDLTYGPVYTTIEIPYTYTDSGSYFPTAFVVDTNGCSNILFATDTLRVGPYPNAIYSIPETTACAGQDITFIDASTGPGDLANWYWDLGDSSFVADSSLTFTHSYAVPGTYTTSLVVETTYGCSDTMTIPVTAISYPEITMQGDTTICPGMLAPLSASAPGATQYTWTPPDYLSATNVSNPISTTDSTITYTVQVDNGYCSSFDSVTVQVVQNLIEDAGLDTSICLGASVDLFVDFNPALDPGLISFFWSPAAYLSNVLSTNPVATPFEDMVYTVDASCGNLHESESADITVNSPPDVEIPEDSILYIEGEQGVLITSTVTDPGPVTYDWEPGGTVDCPTCPDVTATPGETTVYSVRVTNQYGCSDIDFVYVEVKACDENLFKIPNIITPNNDGLNDIFHIKYEGISQVNGYRIYDRWGQLVFATNDPNDAWDGTTNGKACSSGVYVYAIDAICEGGVKSTITGNVTLIR